MESRVFGQAGPSPIVCSITRVSVPAASLTDHCPAHSWRDRLAADNRRAPDRLRLRISAVVGLVGLSPLGFSGGTVVELGRLLDCDPLRKAIAAHPTADLAALISGKLYDYVVA